MSSHQQPVAGKRVDSRFTAHRPNERGVGDTTEWTIPGGRLFLAASIDLSSRFVVGWARIEVNDSQLSLKALAMSLRRRCSVESRLHHTDQGSTGGFNRSSQRLLVEVNVDACSAPRKVSSVQASCGSGC
ncbi:DDE-type integrase/transposase/recombinase [Corallococcus sp. Z5C101001]|uniref:DDE-type integrase/transposase/recombinase n=1 Tax=Corallococcus sp. Z5C101001 TaxID=2596829 RepID=UPI00117EC117|nr:DDE-type integrase/transposase/recombinase [Corallococcus sp. Z5C101001]TSC32858.1 DDE-type integrase/transposase/recombinase [Corallococcus sp. Z5C101001]